MNKRIYLAGPIKGLTYEGATAWREIWADYFKELFIDCYSPMRGKEYLNTVDENGRGELLKDSYTGSLFSDAQKITMRDRNDCMNSDLIVFNFLGATPYDDFPFSLSIGSCIEIGWGDSQRIPMIAVMEQHSLYQHAMITECCMTAETMNEAMKLAEGILIP